jgi:hypothetical protein
MILFAPKGRNVSGNVVLIRAGPPVGAAGVEDGPPHEGPGVRGHGMAETAQRMWAEAASDEERIAPLLDVLGRKLEAASSRISAASCYERAAT